MHTQAYVKIAGMGSNPLVAASLLFGARRETAARYDRLGLDELANAGYNPAVIADQVAKHNRKVAAQLRNRLDQVDALTGVVDCMAKTGLVQVFA